MKSKQTFATSCAIVMALSSLTAGPPPVVEKSPTTAEESDWSFRIAPYGWLQTVGGTVTVMGLPSEIALGIDDILNHLDIAITGVVEARYKRFGVTADLFYVNISASPNTPLNLLFDRVDLDQREFVGNFVAFYRAVDQPTLKLEVYAGARVNWFETTISFIGGPPLLPPGLPPFVASNSSFSRDRSWVDPIVGARLNQRISGPYFVRVLGDVGGFGVSSDFTWEALGMVGVDVARNFSIGLGYRAIGTDYASGDFGYDVVSHGPIFGGEVRF